MASQPLHPLHTARRRQSKNSTRAAVVAAVKGKYAHVRTSSSRFAAAKRAEVHREQ
jgi:PIN domain nuclease of toxin-antitoxin system